MASVTAQTQKDRTLTQGSRALKLAAGAAALVLLLLIFRQTQSNSFGFSGGRPLPRGKVAPQLVRAGNVDVLLAPDGSLWCWGGAGTPETGLVEEPTEPPQRIGSADDWCRVAASPMHALALKTDGSLWAWGWTGVGVSTQGHAQRKVTQPSRLGLGRNWTQIAVGAGHCLALRSDGSLWGWGQNDHGQVGDGGTNNQFMVRRIGHDQDWSAITAGFFSSFALKKNGTLWGWGAFLPGTQDVLSPQPIDLCSNIVAIAANDFILLALRTDGTLWIGGPNAPSTARAFVPVATASLTQIGTDKEWKEVYAGRRFFMARKANGSWWVCGNYHTGPGDPPLTSPQRLPLRFEAWALAPGLGDACLLTRDGALWTLSIQPERGKYAAAIRQAEARINQLLAVLPWHPQPFDLKQFPLNPTPRKHWQWSAEKPG